MQTLSDKLCREHGLSVVDKEHQSEKGSQHYCTHNGIKPKESFRSRLRLIIDCVILESKSFEDFLAKMRQQGVVCTYTPQHKITLRFRLPEQKKDIRARSVGFNYDEQNIRRRIDEALLFRTEQSAKGWRSALIDTSTDYFQSQPNLKRWAEIQNMKLVSEKLNLLTASKSSGESEGLQLTSAIADLSRQIYKLSSVVHNLEMVAKYSQLARQLQNLQGKPFTKKAVENLQTSHRKELEAFHRAESALQNVKSGFENLDGKYPPLSELKAKLESLKSDKAVLTQRKGNLKHELLDIDRARKEVQEYLSRCADLQDKKLDNKGGKARKVSTKSERCEQIERDER